MQKENKKKAPSIGISSNVKHILRNLIKCECGKDYNGVIYECFCHNNYEPFMMKCCGKDCEKLKEYDPRDLYIKATNIDSMRQIVNQLT